MLEHDFHGMKEDCNFLNGLFLLLLESLRLREFLRIEVEVIKDEFERFLTIPISQTKNQKKSD